MILLLAIPLSAAFICLTVLVWQHKQLTFKREMEDLDRKELASKMEARITGLFEQITVSQKAIKRLAEVVMDMSKRQNVKINIDGLTQP